MHEQPSGIPAQPPGGNVPPPPSLPPAPPPPPPPAYAPPPHAYGPAPAGWNPSTPARPSRTGLWIALGVVGAIVLAGAAFAVTRPGDTTQPAAAPAGAAAAPAGGATAPAADGAGAAGGAGSGTQAPGAGNETMGRLHLPDTFLGMKRDDNSPEVAMMRQQIKATMEDDPHKHVVVTSYKSGQFGENHAFVIAIESDVPFSEKDHAEALAEINDGSAQTPGMKVTHGEVKTADPGPLGGVMKCKVTFTKTEAAGGSDLFSAPNCAWLDGNTYVTVAGGDSATGLDLTKAAENARQFRAQAETRR